MFQNSAINFNEREIFFYTKGVINRVPCKADCDRLYYVGEINRAQEELLQ